MSSEKEIRQQLIDEQLRAAGWSVEKGNLVTEYYFPKPSSRIVKEDSEPILFPFPKKRFADYVLLDNNKQPIAVLEAKNNAEDSSPLNGLEQVEEYADRIFDQTGKQPFIFLSNGDETYFWDREYYPPRKVSNVYRLEDLERLRELRLYAQPLHRIQPDLAIVERDYQLRAIQTVIDGIKQRKHKFLLVMATGTGKTRTVIALIDLLIRAKRISRVLFLADRRELVRQASQTFKEFLPAEPVHWIENGIKKDEATIHVATYPGMMQVLSQISTGYYDLIVADESHRSIYNRYQDIFTHFDAMQIGLTATPTDFIEHNTYQLFDCFDNIPTFNYPFETAVENDYLVNFKVLEAQTHFQIEGIKGNELPAELQRQLDEQGIDPGEIDFEGTDLERKVTISGTNDQIVHEFMQHARTTGSIGQPAKSIIFAVSHKHALEIFESFNRLYPGPQVNGLAKVIDSRMERSEKILDDFKTKNMPRVAISVDMLDTGIDVPAIQNLVFAKPVYSQVKFWQMVGRGTRLWHDPITDDLKNDFLIIDHWNNFQYFDINPEGEVSYPGEPLQARLFRLRLFRLAYLQEQGNETLIEETKESLGVMLLQLSSARNIQVHEHKTYLRNLAFNELEAPAQDFAKDGKLDRTIAPLMRFLPGVNAHVLRFEIHTEELMLALLENNPVRIPRLKEQIFDELARLPPELPEVQYKEKLLNWVRGPEFWTHLDLERILNLQKEIVPLMRFRLAEPRGMVKLRLPDQMQTRRWITYGPAGEGAFVDQYRAQVETQVKNLAEQEPTLSKLKRKQQLTASEFTALSELLNKPDLFIREEILQQVYEHPEMRLVDFILSILENKTDQIPSRAEYIEEAVQQFLNQRPLFTQAQRQFIYALRSLLIQQARSGTRTILTSERLTQVPFQRVGKPENLFSAQELDELLQFANYQVSQIIANDQGKEKIQA